MPKVRKNLSLDETANGRIGTLTEEFREAAVTDLLKLLAVDFGRRPKYWR